jgi:chemotaxis protein MotB
MTRKKRQGKVSHDRRLVSYADFITLLFAFFVVLFATGQSDKRKKVELAVSIQSAFSEMGIFQAHSKVPLQSQIRSGGGSAASLALSPPMVPGPESMFMMKRHIEQAAQPEIDRGVIGIHDSANGLVISLQEVGFFESGAAGIRPSGLQVLDRIAAILPESRCVLKATPTTSRFIPRSLPPTGIIAYKLLKTNDK